MLDHDSALQFFHGRLHWLGSGVSSTLCGRCPEHLRTFDAGSIQGWREQSQNNTHHNDNKGFDQDIVKCIINCYNKAGRGTQSGAI